MIVLGLLLDLIGGRGSGFISEILTDVLSLVLLLNPKVYKRRSSNHLKIKSSPIGRRSTSSTINAFKIEMRGININSNFTTKDGNEGTIFLKPSRHIPACFV